jgi:excisionase family DNA binding protein
MGSEVYTVPEIAAYLKVSQSTVRSLVREDEIPYVRVRGRVLFFIPKIREWVSSLHARGTEKKEKLIDDIADDILGQLRRR